jgi:DNA-binding transcriptional MerR regulator
MDRYTLSDLEKLTGIRSGTIRIWERRYRIIKPHRTETNRRWYDDDDLRRILNISILYRHDIKISKIATFSGAEIEEKVTVISSEAMSSDILVDSMIIAMTGFNENSVNEILLRSIIRMGFEKTFTVVVFPFLKRVGVMWQTGSANISAEHFITNLFRRRLIAAIDALPTGTSPERKRAVLFLPENELHEMGLLFYTYVIKSIGHDVLYLGQSTPMNALAEAVELWHPGILVTGSLSGLPFTSPEDYLKRLSSAFQEQKILVSGFLATAKGKTIYPNLFAVRSVDELKNHFS